MDIKSLYFEWMTFLAFKDSIDRTRYSKLLEHLASRTFFYTIPMDRNRYKDGLNLRYRFGYECGISNEIIDREFDGIPCSILEMMVALCLKCEEQIMCNPDLGDRTSCWFSEMLGSLQLTHMENDNYDIHYVEYRLDCLLNHKYCYNGFGGLFTVPKPRCDMREVEIWYQMCWYIGSIVNDI